MEKYSIINAPYEKEKIIIFHGYIYDAGASATDNPDMTHRAVYYENARMPLKEFIKNKSSYHDITENADQTIQDLTKELAITLAKNYYDTANSGQYLPLSELTLEDYDNYHGNYCCDPDDITNLGQHCSTKDTIIKIKYFTDIEPVEQIENGDWIDLRAACDVTLKTGEFKLIPLGVGMKLPDGYEAHLAPRSSTFKNFGIIQTNSTGIIDNSYSGDNDQWMMPVYATRNIEIHKNDRICQFRIMKKQQKCTLLTVDHLDNTDRGGFGSTGVQ